MQELETYIREHSDGEGDYLYRLYRATNIHTIHGRMASGHLQGRLLKMFVMMQRPQYILEVGTFSGYSAICMAEGLAALEGRGERGERIEDTPAAVFSKYPQDISLSPLSSPHSPLLSPPKKLYTFEINDEMEDFTRPWLEGSPVAPYIDFRIGDVNIEAPRLGVKFDMLFLDGDKRTYIETYENLLPLMNPGALILADNTLWDGHVIDPAYDHDRQTQGIRLFNDHIRDDRRVEKVILPMRDGLTMIKVKY